MTIDMTVEIKLLKVNKKLIDKYRDVVKGNKEKPDDQVVKRLTRNVIMANEVNHSNKFKRWIGVKVYHYGNLHITLIGNRVIEIVNHPGGHHYKGWRKDEKLYNKLNEKLGIN